MSTVESTSITKKKSHVKIKRQTFWQFTTNPGQVVCAKNKIYGHPKFCPCEMISQQLRSPQHLPLTIAAFSGTILLFVQTSLLWNVSV